MRLCPLVPGLLSVRLVLTRSLKLVPVLGLFAALIFVASPAFAQSSTPDSNDDAVLTPAEPDYRLINLPTTLRLPLHKGSFALTHRFNGNLRNGSFSDQARASSASTTARRSASSTGSASSAICEVGRLPDELRPDDSAVRRSTTRSTRAAGRRCRCRGCCRSKAATTSTERYAPSVGATISRQIDEPSSRSTSCRSGCTTSRRCSRITGVERQHVHDRPGRARVRISAHGVHLGRSRRRGVAGTSARTPEYAFGIEKRAGAHMFQLNFGNSQGTTFAQTAHGGFPTRCSWAST